MEDLIQESMQRGDFDNLAGYGKPIDYKDRNPLLDATTYKINKMLKDEGFAPDWIMLEKDIRLGSSTEQWWMILMISDIHVIFSFPFVHKSYLTTGVQNLSQNQLQSNFVISN